MGAVVEGVSCPSELIAALDREIEECARRKYEELVQEVAIKSLEEEERISEEKEKDKKTQITAANLDPNEVVRRGMKALLEKDLKLKGKNSKAVLNTKKW